MRCLAEILHFSFGDNGAPIAAMIVESIPRPAGSNITDMLREMCEEAYCRSNSVHSQWWKDAQVKVLPDGKTRITKNGGLRSTSVGDTIRLTPEGKESQHIAFVVAPMGFLPEAEALKDDMICMHRNIQGH